MITFSLVMIGLFIMSTYKIHKNSKAKDEEFNPFNSSLWVYMSFTMSWIYLMMFIISFMLKYLP